MLTFLLPFLAAGCDAVESAPSADEPMPHSGETPCGTGLVAEGDLCVAEACGTGPWGDAGVEARWFVSQQGDVGPAGEHAYGDIGDAVKAAEAEGGGGTIAVAAGSYVERLVVYDEAAGIRVVGRCAELVTIDGSEGRIGSPTVYIELPEGEPFGLAGVTVTGGVAYGVYIGGGEVSLADLVVEGNSGYGLQARGETCSVNVDNTEIRGTMLSNGVEGFGLSVTNGARMSMVGGSVHDNEGFGVSALSGAVFEASGVWLAYNVTANIGVEQADATVSGATIAAPAPSEDAGGVAYGGFAIGSANLTIRDSVVADSVGVGLFVQGEGSELTLERSVVSATSTSPDGEAGWGAAAATGGLLTVRDSELRDNVAVGAFASEEGSTLIIEGSELIGNGTDTRVSLGGIYVTEHAHATVESTKIRANGGTAIAVAGPGSLATIRSCLLADTLPGSVDFGLLVRGGAAVEMYDSEVSGMPGTAISIAEPESTLLMEDSTVTGGPGTSIAVYGRDGGAMTLHRVDILNGSDFGVLLSDASLIAESLSVVATSTAEPSFNQFQYAIGVAAFGDSTASLQDAVLAENAGPGLFVAVGANVACERCDVSNNAFAGVVVLGGELSLLESNVSANGVAGGFGFGGYIAGAGVVSTVSVEGSDFEDHAYAHIWVDGTHSVDLVGNRFGVSSGLPLRNGATLHGNSVFATQNPSVAGAPQLLLEGNQMGTGGGPAVLLDGATATIDSASGFESDRTGVWQQGCEEVDPPLSVPEGVTNSICIAELQTDPQEFSLSAGDIADIASE